MLQGRLEMAKFLFEKGGRPNLDAYCDGDTTPVHIAACWERIATLKWVFKENVLSLDVLNIKSDRGWTVLDNAISCENLEAAQYLWMMGGRPNLEIYNCDGKWLTPMHCAARYGKTTATLKWVFAKGVLPLRVLQIKDEQKMTPLDIANKETAAFLQHLVYVNPVFLAMQCAKRDYHQCVLRRLPDELLDMVVDEVAVRFRLKVEW